MSLPSWTAPQPLSGRTLYAVPPLADSAAPAPELTPAGGAPVAPQATLVAAIPAPRSPHAQAADHYLAERVHTATPAELTQMLYDAAVAALHKSRQALADGDREALRAPLAKAQDIVLELRCSLNTSAGAIAGQLDSLYAYAYGRLIDAGAGRDGAAVDEVLSIVEPLRAAWREACVRIR